MKSIYKPLSQPDKTASDTTTGPRKKTPKSSNFKQMLAQHIEASRQGAPKSLEAPSTTTPQNSLDNQANLEVLKDLDVGYYNKGLKKQTLAESFSADNSSKLEKRLSKYQHLIEMKAKKYKLDPNLLAGLVRQESNFNPYAVSHCGAMGLGQLMPETARYLGVTDPFNAAQNLDGAARYLREQLDTFGGNVEKALAAYNAGPGAVRKHGGIPPYRETQNYVRAIKSHVGVIAAKDVFVKKA